MAEKLKPFIAGVEVEETCRLGIRGRIVVSRPPEAGNKAFRTYLATCRESCDTCNFRSKQLCTTIDYKGVAGAECFSDKLMKGLKKHKAPCIKNKVKFTDWKSHQER